MGKPLGYGKLKMNEIILNSSNNQKEIKNYMAIFEKEICTEEGKTIFDQWKKDVAPLFKIASGNYNGPIHYPVGFKQFKEIKIKRMSLTDFAPTLNDFKLKSLNI